MKYKVYLVNTRLLLISSSFKNISSAKIKSIKNNNVTLVNDFDIANAFNDFFVNVVSSLLNNTYIVNHYMTFKIDHHLSFNIFDSFDFVSFDEVLSYIKYSKDFD